MKKKLNLSITVFLILFICLFSLCRFNYSDPDNINPADYYPAINELLGKHSLIQTSFHADDPQPIPRHLELRSFDKTLSSILPKCYKLLKENRAVEIDYFSDQCIFIILKIHTGIINDRWECLKIGSANDCDLSNKADTEVEKEVPLKNGWKYQVVTLFIET